MPQAHIAPPVCLPCVRNKHHNCQTQLLQPVVNTYGGEEEYVPCGCRCGGGRL